MNEEDDLNRVRQHVALYAMATNRDLPLDLPQVLELAKSELALTHRAQENVGLHPRWDIEDYNSNILKYRLGDFHPFVEIETKTLQFASGSASTGHGISLNWVARQILKGTPVADIITIANTQYAENGYDALEITKVLGIKVRTVVELIQGYELWPPDQLPSDYRKRLAFETNGPGFQPEAAALVHRFRHGPVYDAPDPFEISRYKLPVFQKLAQLDEKRSQVREALLLSVDTAVEFPMRYYSAVGDHILAYDRSYQYSREPFAFDSAEPDVHRVRSLHSSLEGFKQSAAVRLVIDRIGRARTSHSPVDKALDLGMALEVALMHENKNSPAANNEITYKIATRAAWLLGKDPESRKVAYSIANKIYGHRSAAVHTGRLRNAADFHSLNAEGFVRNVVLEILRRGDFPDWKELVLGID
ncbi:hypothetical protein HFO04_01545 [Rhizobium laguerreae]|uniref:HEPN domain-containing protein n=1 Tax=Rhizobium laguerreae TaxID=1076926 RepID=UPI001C91428F|nr:HEPN domain-containing protein [Rhizobium laguerreae]MBY3301493.1 hypothetical protein [Rhizobium laguerreae]